MYNTYGPTETTVSASAELLPGQPVTIGTPLPNYGMLIRGETARCCKGRWASCASPGRAWRAATWGGPS